jgi:hypothetical protein
MNTHIPCLVLVAVLASGAAQAVPVGAPPYLNANLDPERALFLSRSERLIAFARTPNFKSVRDAATALVARGTAALARGDEPEALRHWLAVLRLSSAMGHGAAGRAAPVVQVMVGRLVESMAVEALMAHARSGTMSAHGAARALAALAQRDREQAPPLADVIRAEGRMVADDLARCESAVRGGDLDAIGRLLNTGGDLLDLAHVHTPDRPRLLRELTWRTREYYEGAATAVAAGQAPAPAVGRADHGLDADDVDPRWEMLRGLLSTNLTSAFCKTAQRDRELAALRTLCTQVATR